MKKAAIVLIVISAVVVGYFVLRPTQPALQPALRNDATLRTTTAGDVVGFIGDHGAQVWLGIPFAKPPVGDLRWRTPRPPEPWEGARETLAVGNICPQMASLLSGDGLNPTRKVAGAEDCLYLNVYAPANSSELPVMFWLHGGGNSIGHGGSYNGARLATARDVVVVTINYRLAHLGWFSHPALKTGLPSDDSGNYGTLDMIRALQWTRDNITAFGGDPNNVTVFGESAGATDTLTMVASPLAAGLFHRGIVQSGGLRITPMSTAQNYASDGGHEMSSREIVNHLLVNDGTVADLRTAQARQEDMQPPDLRDYLYSKSVEELFSMFDTSMFGMINTPDVLGDGYVLPASNAEEILSDPDKHNSVPMILGTNRDEPSLFMARNPEYVDTFLWIFPRLKDEASYLRAVKYGALAWKERGVDSLATYLTASGNPNVYAYRFDWDEEGSMMGYDLSKALGAAHALEIAFVFGNFTEGLGLGYLYDASEAKDALSDSMMSYWTEFAYTGNPGTGRDGKDPQWLSWGTDGKSSIILDTVSDQGIFMMSDVVSKASIKLAIVEDPEIADQRERCTYYVRSFRWSGDFIQDEYDNLGSQGCSAYDPADLDGF